jgi:pimeloyl-ACP methyl ester carboxylesterase
MADSGQRRASAYALHFQLPRLPERRLTRADDDPVADLMQRWSGPAWTHTPDFAAAVQRYRSAARIPQAAYGAMEYYRWAFRSQLRPDGLRYARRMAAPVSAPTLQLHGSLDRCILPSTAQGSGRYVAGTYEWRDLPGIGHFPPEEAPEDVTEAITTWAR